MTYRGIVALGFALAISSCASTSATNPIPTEGRAVDPVSLAGTWRMSGQMMSRGFAFQGILRLEVVGDQVTGEFRMRTPSARFGQVAGSYKDGYLVLNGWQEIELSFQCRGQANLRLLGSENRLSGDIEITDGCNKQEFRGTVRLQR
jgi:hypothetical protein